MARKKSRNRNQSTTLTAKTVKMLFVLMISFIASLSLIGDFSPTIPVVQKNDVPEAATFIESIAPAAQQMQKQYGVFASISIAQAILESDWGNSELSSVYNNLYGMKGDSLENTVLLSTQEFYNGEWVTVQADFKVYDSWASSVQDHALLIANGTSWNANQYAPVLQAKSYREAAQALQDCGYATDPDYANKLISVIEQNTLYNYDS